MAQSKALFGYDGILVMFQRAIEGHTNENRSHDCGSVVCRPRMAMCPVVDPQDGSRNQACHPWYGCDIALFMEGRSTELRSRRVAPNGSLEQCKSVAWIATLFRATRTPTAFTLVEILLVLFLAGLVALPLSRLFLFGVQGSHDNAEHIMAFNLAREKLEEVRTLPFALVKSDFDQFRMIFRDRPELDQAFEDRAVFDATFTDIFTEEGLKNEVTRETFNRFKPLYQKAFQRPYELYPEDLSAFRRVLEVDKRFEARMPPRLKKVTVRIFDQRQRKIAELSTLIGSHK